MITRLFTDRAGGASKGRFSSFNLGLTVGDDPADVSLNRSNLEDLTSPLVIMNQVHGDTVIVVEGQPDVSIKADAVVTQESGIALAVLVADCIPVLLWDEESSCIAAVHVGRRGLLNEIIHKTIQVMRELGADRISAEFGPAICGKCYEVGQDVFEEVITKYPRARCAESAFDFALDLPAALEHELLQLSIPVLRTSICTFESEGHYSYRRDGVTGRAAGVIWQ